MATSINGIGAPPPVDFSQKFTIEEGSGAEEKPAMEYIYITDDKLKYINNRYEKVNAKMYDYKCDVKLIVGGSNFKGHRKVLVDASDYFAAMFTHDMKEKDETVIELKEISPSGFTAMLDYFYHGHVTIEGKIIPDILEAARFFHVDWILDVSCDYMVRHLSHTDYSLTMHLADKFSLGDLRYDIFKYFGTHLPQLLEKEDFLKNLSADLLLQFLMEDLYVEYSEFFLLQVVIDWVQADEANHKEHFLSLLRQIKFYTMDLEELEEIPESVTKIDKEIKETIEDAKMYCLTVGAQCLVTGEKYHARGSEPCVVMSTFNEELEANTVVYKDPENDDANLFVEQLGPSGLTSDYSTMSQTSLGNFLFAAGGYGPDLRSCAQVFRYDPRFREWTEIASMSLPRVSLAMCSSKNKVYAIGGVLHSNGELERNEEILKSVEMYMPEENSWKLLADLPFGIFDHAAAAWGNKVYVCGGISVNPDVPIPMDNTFCLAEGSDQWTPLPPMQTKRQGHSLTAHEGKLYALGGYTGKEDGAGFANCYSNEVFDTETKQWTALANTPEHFGHLYRHVGLVNNKIYFLCTENSNVYLSSYNIGTNEFDLGVEVGANFQKVSVLNVAYPH